MSSRDTYACTWCCVCMCVGIRTISRREHNAESRHKSDRKSGTRKLVILLCLRLLQVLFEQVYITRWI